MPSLPSGTCVPKPAGTTYFCWTGGLITGRAGDVLTVVGHSHVHSNFNSLYYGAFVDQEIDFNNVQIFWPTTWDLGDPWPPAGASSLNSPLAIAPGTGGYPTLAALWAAGDVNALGQATPPAIACASDNVFSASVGTPGTRGPATIAIDPPSLWIEDAAGGLLAALPNGTPGIAYDLGLPSFGGTRKIHGKTNWAGLADNFSITATGLPAGVALASDGTFSGSPTVYGLFAVVIRATSTTPGSPFAGFYGDVALALNVPCPVITVTPSDVLPSDVSKVVVYGAVGGTGPYTYALTGTKPSTWTFAGATLTAPVPMPYGSYDFTITATDALGCTGAIHYAFTSPDIELPSGDFVGLSWVELTDKAGVLHKWARVALPDPIAYFGGYKEPRVQSFGTVRRSLSDDYGQPETIDFSFTISDTDHLVRALLENHTTRSLTGRSVVARMIPDDQRRLLLAPRTYFRGFVSDYKLEPQLHVTFTAQDPLAVRFSRTSDAEQLPKRLITSADFAEAPTEPLKAFPNVPVLIGAPVPIIYGEITDTQIAAATVATVNQLAQDATIPAPVLESLQRVAGTIADPLAVHVAITAIKAGKEGPFSNVITLPARGGVPSTFGIRANFPAVAGVDSYRIYFTDDRNVIPYVTNAAATRLLYLTHDNATVDGANPPSYQVTLTDPAGAGVVDLIGGSAPGTVDAGVGQCPILYVGDVTLPDGYQWRRFLIAGHACKEITEVYADNRPLGIRKPGYWPAGLLTPADFGAPLWVDLVVPGTPSWAAMFGGAAPPYEDINGRRYTCLYVKVNDIGGDRAAGFQPSGLPDVVPGAVSVKGIEDVGDGSGTLITDLLLQYRHCLQNWILGDYQSGAWLASPVHADDPSIAIIDDDSFETASTIAGLRVAGGYRGDFMIGATAIGANATRIGGERISVRDLVARFNVCADVNSGWNRHTQFFVSMLNDFDVSLAGLPRLTHTSDIYKDSLTITDDLTKLWNVVPFRHTVDYFGRNPTGWRSAKGAETIDALSILEYAPNDAPAGLRRVAPVLDLPLLRGVNGPTDYTGYAQGSVTAADVVRRWLTRHKDPPRTIEIHVGPVGMNLEIGDVIRATHYGGTGEIGFVDRPMRIVRHDTDPNSLTVSLTLLDVYVIYSGGVILGDDTAQPVMWPAATPAQRYYAYLADDATGKFSDGAVGKRFR